MLSVLLPVRDGSATLAAALHSLREQNRRPDRIVAIDDGSVDGSAGILREWQRSWDAVEVIPGPRRGLAAALNAGLRVAIAAGSRWIARMDADDRCAAGRFETQLAFAERHGLGLVGCEVTYEGSAAFSGMREHVAWANAQHSHEELARAVWVDSPMPHPGWLARREAWEQVGFYDEGVDVPEDYEWLHRYFSAARRGGAKAGKPRDPLLVWTDSPERLSRTGAAYREAAFHAVRAKALATWLSERGLPPRVQFVGLGRRGKGLLPLLEREVEIAGIVDVHPGRVGMRYRGVEVRDVARWKRERSPLFLVVCLGTAASRAKAAAFFRAEGLVEGESFLTV